MAAVSRTRGPRAWQERGDWWFECSPCGRTKRRLQDKRHAVNTMNLHMRMDHPGEPVPDLEEAPSSAGIAGGTTLDLSAAARAVLDPWATTVDIWQALTGLEPAASKEFAERIAQESVLAHVPPF